MQRKIETPKLGDRYEKLEVVEVLFSTHGGSVIARCDCGNTTRIQFGIWVDKKHRSCGCWRRSVKGPRQDCIGQRFGDLVVQSVERVDKGTAGKFGYVYNCLCACGRTCKQPRDRLTSGRAQRCVYCRDHSFHTGKNHYGYSGVGDMPGLVWSHLKGGAQARNLPFLITKEFLWELFQRQEGRCQLTGLELKSGRKHLRENSASVDRIDSSRPYTEDNVQWVHKEVNLMKWSFPLRYFQQLCRLIADRSNGVSLVEPVGESFGLWQIFGNVFDSQGRRVGVFAKCECGKCEIFCGHEEVKLLTLAKLSCGCRTRGFLGEPAQAAPCGYPGIRAQNYFGLHGLSISNWNLIVRGAAARSGGGYKVGITMELAEQLFQKQQRRCALTGIKIYFPTPANGESRIASLDRIDNTQGYVAGNVQWLHKDVNRLKNRFLQSRVIEICRLVTEKSPRHLLTDGA